MRALILLISILLLNSFVLYGQKGEDLSLLKISENGRFIKGHNGEPFFWLGDTGWLLFSKLDREEAEKYLDDRANKGFNVI